MLVDVVLIVNMNGLLELNKESKLPKLKFQTLSLLLFLMLLLLLLLSASSVFFAASCLKIYDWLLAQSKDCDWLLRMSTNEVFPLLTPNKEATCSCEHCCMVSSPTPIAEATAWLKMSNEVEFMLFVGGVLLFDGEVAWLLIKMKEFSEVVVVVEITVVLKSSVAGCSTASSCCEMVWRLEVGWVRCEVGGGGGVVGCRGRIAWSGLLGMGGSMYATRWLAGEKL